MIGSLLFLGSDFQEKKLPLKESISHSRRWDLPGAVGTLKVNEDFNNRG